MGNQTGSRKSRKNRKVSEKRKYARTLRDSCAAALQARGVLLLDTHFYTVAEASERLLGVTPNDPSRDTKNTIFRLGAVCEQLGLPPFKPELARGTPAGVPLTPNTLRKQDLTRRLVVFYRSQAWRRLRYEVLLKYSRACMACGATDTTIHVDHIKPLRKYWNLRLDFNNLQVLCEECNHGKGSWDETDFRPQRTPIARFRPRVAL